MFATWLLCGCLCVSAARGATVYLEDSPAAQDLIAEAAELEAQGRAGDAVVRLQRVVDEFGDKLMQSGESSYTDAARWVRRHIAGDADRLAAYRGRFSADAERALREALEPRPDASALRGVMERYALTDAGLTAALRLAGHALESADADSAAATLRAAEAHPDFAARSAEAVELEAWVAALRGDDTGLRASLDQLTAQPDGSAALRDTLLAVAARHDALASAWSDTTATPPLDRPLWQVDLTPPGDLGDQRVYYAAASGERNEVTPTLQPTAVGRSLLVSDNERVVSLDRVSGRLRWVYEYVAPKSENHRFAFAGYGRVTLDERRVVAVGDAVVSVMGFTVPWQGRRAQLAPATQLVCLDAETGSQRWVVSAEQLDETLGRASFHGTPIAHDGNLLVMARRNQASSFQDSYLLCINPENGTLRWRRHLGSTAGDVNRGGIVTLSSMTLRGDRLYFCDNLGVAAALNPRTGSVHWLTLLGPQQPADRRPPGGGLTTLSNHTDPVLCEAGLVLPLALDNRRGLLLDPRTGEVLRDLTDTPIATAAEVIPLADDDGAAGDLLVIGSSVQRVDDAIVSSAGDVRRLDGRTFETQWTFTPPSRDDPTAPPHSTVVSVVGPTALVSTGRNRIDQIDLVTGKPVADFTAPFTGHTIALRDGWFVSSGNTLGGYLDWQSAYDRLVSDAQAQPDSPDPGLDLALLAVNAGRPDAVGQGVELAMSALARLARGAEADAAHVRAARGRVIRELISLTQRPGAGDPQAIEAIFDRLATAADTPAERVATLLARGAFLEAQQRPEEAVAAYQSILLDERLAREPFEQNGATRRGDIAARQRLFDLVEASGPAVYGVFDRRARSELDALLASPGASTGQLLEIERRYPLAGAAAEALLAAAGVQSRSTPHAAAITHYRRAFALADTAEIRQRAAGGLAEYYATHGRPDAALRWLEQVSRGHPDLMPVRDGRPVTTAQWIASLETQSPRGRAARRPALSPALGRPVTLEGVPVRYLDEEAGQSDFAPHLLVRSGRGNRSTLSLISLPGGETRWSIPAPEGDPGIVALRDDHALLFSPHTQTLHALQLGDGAELWPALELPPLLAEVGENRLAEARRRTAGTQVLQIIQGNEAELRQIRGLPAPPPPSTSPRVVAGESIVCAVDPEARAIGIDPFTGEVLWHYALPLDAVTHCVVLDDTLAVAGQVTPDSDSLASVVVLLDLATGRPRFPAIEEREPLQWIGQNVDGDVLALSTTSLTLYDRRDGRVLFRTVLPPFNDNPSVARSDTQPMVYIHAANQLVALDGRTGQIIAQSSDNATRFAPLVYDDALLTLQADAAVALSPQLQTLWRDAIDLTPKRLVTQRLAANTLFILAQPTPAPAPGIAPGNAGNAGIAPGDATLHLYALDPATGRLLAQTLIPQSPVGPLPPIIMLRPHALILCGNNQTMILPSLLDPKTDP